MPLKTLRVRVDHLWMAAGALFLVLGSVVAWRALAPEDAGAQAELDGGLEQLRSKSRKPGSSPDTPRFIQPIMNSSGAGSEPERIGWAESQFTQAAKAEQVGPEQAVDEFKAVVAELEAAVEAGGRLSEREQGELYNRATGSFTALSAWIDASNPSERALMDDAYGQMMTLMRQLDLEPPAHNPDGALVRR